MKFITVSGMLFLFLFCSIVADDCSHCKITNRLASIVEPTNKRELIQFNENFKTLDECFLPIVDYLITFKDDSTIYIDDAECKINKRRFYGFNLKSENIGSTIIPVNRLNAAYLITSLYYGDYFFASDKILYAEGMSDTTDFYTYYLKNPIYLDSVWSSIIIWRKEIDGLNVDKVRKMELHPLQYTPQRYFWIGERGGSINAQKTHRPFVKELNPNDLFEK